MYKSIIFDIGGVLVDFDPKAYLVDRLCNAEMEEKVYDLTFGSEEWQLLDAGKLSRRRAHHPVRGQPADVGQSQRTGLRL